MEQAFFPVQIAGEIVLLNILTAIAFAMTLATGAGRTSSRGIPAGPQLGLVLVLAVWYAVVYALTANGWISLDVLLFGKLPTLLAAIAAPTAVGILLLYFTGFRKLIDGVPVSLLAAFHGLRIPFGFVFLAVYELGEIPWEFASRGGYGDITAGLLLTSSQLHLR